jgi:polysaccharide export outer membrane protein
MVAHAVKSSRWLALLLLVVLVVSTGCGTQGQESIYSRTPASAKYRSRTYSYERGQYQVEDPQPEESYRRPARREPAPRISAPVRSEPEYRPQPAVDTINAYRLKPGDPIVISLRGIPREEHIEDIIDESGFVTLPYLNAVKAAGKTSSELERDVRSLYLSQQIYRNISVNVVVPSQGYYVRGEVKKPGRYPLMSGLTLVQAVAAAGGYTEFANPKRTSLLREGKTKEYDVREMERRPEKDIPIKVGDVIVVPRSVF